VPVTDEDLRQRLERLEEQVQSLIVAVRYRRDEPWERELLTLGIHGRDRQDLMQVIASVLHRAVGELPISPRDTASAHPAVLVASKDAPIDRAEAIRLVMEVAGCNNTVTRRLLKAWADRGLGGDVTAVLGL
jgi:hypothetical protein